MKRSTLALSALLLCLLGMLGTQHALRAQVMGEEPAMQGIAEEPAMMPPGGPMPSAEPQPLPPAQPILPPEPAPQLAPALNEAIELKAGDILEILPIHTLAQPTYAWILTKERAFIQADRNPLFRIRLTEPGTYTLTAEVTSGDRTARVRKVFPVVIAQRTPGAMPAAQGAKLVTAAPRLTENGDIVLPRGGQTVLLTPTGNLRPLNIDLDLAADTDGNGNPGDDVDNVGTLFQTDATPVLLWFLDPVTKRDMQVSAPKADGTLLTQAIAVRGIDQARSEGVVQSPVSIQAAERGDGTHQFSVQFADGSQPEDPLLYRWQFSDGTESLELQPIRAVSATGGLTVTVSVRNLMTGTDIGTATKTVLPAAPASSAASSGASEAASSAASEEPSEPAPESDGGILARIMPFVPLVGAFIGAVVVGMIVVAIVSTLRRKRGGAEKTGALQQHFAQMETKLLQKEQEKKTAVAQPAPPAPPEAIAEREVTRSLPSRQPEPAVDVQQAPSWLKQGLQGKPAAAAPKQPATATPAPAAPPAPPATKPAAPAPAPKPAPAPAPQKQPEQKPQAPKPAPPPAPAQPKPAPAPSPEPAAAKPITPPPAAAAPAQKPAPAPAPEAPKPAPAPAAPVPAPAAEPAAPIDTGNAPSWLKQGLQGKPDLSTPAPAPSAPAPAAPHTPPPAAPTPPSDDPTVAVIKAEGLG